jgi:hypothetical protein
MVINAGAPFGRLADGPDSRGVRSWRERCPKRSWRKVRSGKDAWPGSSTVGLQSPTPARRRPGEITEHERVGPEPGEGAREFVAVDLQGAVPEISRVSDVADALARGVLYDLHLQRHAAFGVAAGHFVAPERLLARGGEQATAARYYIDTPGWRVLRRGGCSAWWSWGRSGRGTAG